jgi:ketosteroid isomerase-like protein
VIGRGVGRAENIKLVRKSYEHFAARGELALDLVADDFEFDPSDVMPDMKLTRGAAAAEPMFRSYAGMFDDFEIKLEEVIAADDDRVVTAVSDGGRIKGTIAEVRNRFFHVFTLSEGRITRWSSHTSRERALEVAGLK